MTRRASSCMLCKSNTGSQSSQLPKPENLTNLLQNDRRASCSYKVIRLRPQLVAKFFDYGPFRKFRLFFLKKMSFSYQSTLFRFCICQGDHCRPSRQRVCSSIDFQVGVSTRIGSAILSQKMLKKLKIFERFRIAQESI